MNLRGWFTRREQRFTHLIYLYIIFLFLIEFRKEKVIHRLAVYFCTPKTTYVHLFSVNFDK